MTGPRTAFALAMAFLVLSIVVAIVLIPWLDEMLRKAIAQKEAAESAANDNARAAAQKPKRQIG
ncbi:hypothetical protein [Methylobacterium sp. J-070]|uniref:hypothetical protein n=1 Tax=Methylobacterium sp. J-070 TaxID=2836650 RepID=UPI001FB9DE73|nr:hypothetical protein [Methylobacterium sp. J-070]MCJ2051674.1 hypothetical protein [Methylobacterium sp. J-070]